LKKWAVDSKLVFENYGKDTIVIRNNEPDFIPNLYVFAHFCAGDDYAGKANNIVIQENFPTQGSQGSAEGINRGFKKGTPLHRTFSWRTRRWKIQKKLFYTTRTKRCTSH
jgi:hypothetical protein